MDNDGSWNSYNEGISAIIEKLKVGKSYQYTFSGNNQKYQITKNSKDDGVQIDTNTSVSRKVRKY